MNMALFSAQPYDRRFFESANVAGRQTITFLGQRLTPATADLAQGQEAVCAFVNDQLSAEVLVRLQAGGTRLIALRSAGYNQVDLAAAARIGLTVVHVPSYSPHAVAEHTLALILALNRHVPRAHNRVRDGNFSINGLLGFDLHGKTVGLVGVGKIGSSVARIFHGFGCRVLAVDPALSAESTPANITLSGLNELLAQADVVSLHCPLNAGTRHLIDAAAIASMKRGVMLINTSRGALIDTAAATAGLLSGQIGYLGLDVYEEEGGLFYEDRSDRMITDAVFARLLTLPNVLITAHQAFFTYEALVMIAATTLRAASDFADQRRCEFTLVPAQI
jgi:D-lactate dehydrogenase